MSVTLTNNAYFGLNGRCGFHNARALEKGKLMRYGNRTYQQQVELVSPNGRINLMRPGSDAAGHAADILPALLP